MKSQVKVKTSKPLVEVNTGKKGKIKKPKYPGQTSTSLTLALEIILVISLGFIALAPMLSALFGILLGFLVFCGAAISTVATAFMALISSGFRQFWVNAFEFVGKIFNSSATIKDSLKGSIIWLSIVIFVVAASGFITNLIFFIKHKKNKGKFIASCIFLVLGIVNLILAMLIYLK